MKYFTKQWYKDCQKPLWCFKAHRRAREIIDNYAEYFKQIKPLLPECLKAIDIDSYPFLHDEIIENGIFVNTDFHMNFLPDGSYSYIDKEKIIFINAEIVKCDFDLKDVTCIDDEFYVKENGQYEMHILFWSKGKLGEIIIVFDDMIIIERNKKEEE
jgi:hypothetical protein